MEIIFEIRNYVRKLEESIRAGSFLLEGGNAIQYSLLTRDTTGFSVDVGRLSVCACTVCVCVCAREDSSFLYRIRSC